MNRKELKSAMARYGDTQKKLAEAIGLNTSNLNSRINGHVDFRASEIAVIKRRYGLSDTDTAVIFFTTDASK